MAVALQQRQIIPVQIHQADERLVLAAPMPGLEAEDISVTIRGSKVIIRGEYRGSRQNQPEIVVSEWTIGPYYREIDLPQAVDGVLTNATYGNGVLVLTMPILAPEAQEAQTEFHLEATHGSRGQRIGHTGSDIQPVMQAEYHQHVEQTSKQTAMVQAMAQVGAEHPRR